MFAAAASDDSDLQRSLISLIHSYAFMPSSNLPVSPLYDPTSGDSSVSGINRLAQVVVSPLTLTLIIK